MTTPTEPTTLWAEWDHTNGHIVSIRNDDRTDQYGPQTQFIDTSSYGTNAVLEWLPLVVDFPQDYLPRFRDLLGPASFVLVNGVVRQQFPGANFDASRVRALLADMVRRTTRDALGDTDWYVIRFIETDIPIPDEVLLGRRAIRTRCDEKIAEIGTLTNERLLDYDTQVSPPMAFHQERDPATGKIYYVLRRDYPQVAPAPTTP